MTHTLAVPDSRVARSRRPRLFLLLVLLGLGAVAAARLCTLPRSLWEGDEVLFAKGVELFDPLHHRPHPPGYPLLIGLGKAPNLLLHDPFASLVSLSVLSSLVGYLALVDAFRRLAPGEGAAREAVAIAGATLFHLSPAMLVYGPLALSDPPALMFLSLALAAAARLRESAAAGPALALGAAAAAAVGCRPQLAVAVLPMLAVALWPAIRGRSRRLGVVGGAAVAAFTVVALLWFVPLVRAVGGPGGLLPFLAKQADLVARFDAGGGARSAPVSPVVVPFLAHPWGNRWTSVPVLALAALGTTALVAGRRSAALPLAVLCGVDLAFALAVMNPADAVRYALPSLLGVAFAAALGAEILIEISAAALARRAGRTKVRAMGLAAVALLVVLLTAGFVVYTLPVLAVRTTTVSPPMQAVRWVARTLPQDAVLLVDPDMAPYTSYLLADRVLRPADPGLAVAAEWRAGTPVFLLAAAESGWPGAVSFRWPESAPYDTLTRGRYRTVSVSPIPPERRYAALRGVGGYEPGIYAPSWRWLGPDAAIRLVGSGGPGRSAGASRVAVTFGLPEFAPLPMALVNVAVDGAAPRSVSVPRGGRRTLVLPLPAGTAAAQVTFGSPVSFVPADLGMGHDRRHLAVQLLDVVRQAP